MLMETVRVCVCVCSRACARPFVVKILEAWLLSLGEDLGQVKKCPT